MAGRPRQFDEIEIIERAAEVFWVKGYEAASAEELLMAMNIGKGSFYLTFKGGKRELFEKTLEHFSKESLEKLSKGIASSHDKLAYLKQVFYELTEDAHVSKNKGCYLGNAIVEMSNLDRELQLKAGYLLYKHELEYVKIISTLQGTGAIKTPESPEILGKYLINLWNGINITKRCSGDASALRSIIDLSFKIFT